MGKGEGEGGEGQEEGASDEGFGQMEFEISIEMARKAHLGCISKLKHFWKHASKQHKSVGSVDSTAHVSTLIADVDELEAEQTVATTEYERLIDKYPQSIQLLRMYASFCDTILNDVRKAEALQSQADILDGEENPRTKDDKGEWEQSTMSEREPYRAQIQTYMLSHRDKVMGEEVQAVNSIHRRVALAVLTLAVLSTAGFVLTDQLLLNDYALTNIEKVDRTGLFRAYSISSNFLLRSLALHAFANDTAASAAVSETMVDIMDFMRSNHRLNYETIPGSHVKGFYLDEVLQADVPTDTGWQRANFSYWTLTNDFTRRVMRASTTSMDQLRDPSFDVSTVSEAKSNIAYVFQNTQQIMIPTLEAIVSLYEDRVRLFAQLSFSLSVGNACMNGLLTVVIAVFVLRSLVKVLQMLNFRVIFCTLALSAPRDVSRSFYNYYSKIEHDMRVFEDEELQRRALEAQAADARSVEGAQDARSVEGARDGSDVGLLASADGQDERSPRLPLRRDCARLSSHKGVAWNDRTGSAGVSFGSFSRRLPSAPRSAFESATARHAALAASAEFASLASRDASSGGGPGSRDASPRGGRAEREAGLSGAGQGTEGGGQERSLGKSDSVRLWLRDSREAAPGHSKSRPTDKKVHSPLQGEWLPAGEGRVQERVGGARFGAGDEGDSETEEEETGGLGVVRRGRREGGDAWGREVSWLLVERGGSEAGSEEPGSERQQGAEPSLLSEASPRERPAASEVVAEAAPGAFIKLFADDDPGGERRGSYDEGARGASRTEDDEGPAAEAAVGSAQDRVQQLGPYVMDSAERVAEDHDKVVSGAAAEEERAAPLVSAHTLLGGEEASGVVEIGDAAVVVGAAAGAGLDGVDEEMRARPEVEENSSRRGTLPSAFRSPASLAKSRAAMSAVPALGQEEEEEVDGDGSRGVWQQPLDKQVALLHKIGKGHRPRRTQMIGVLLLLLLALSIFSVQWPARRVYAIVNLAAATNQAARRRYLLRSCVHFSRELVLDDGLSRMHRAENADALRFYLETFKDADHSVRLGGRLGIARGADEYSAAHNAIMYGEGCPWRADPSDCSLPVLPGAASRGLHMLMLAFFSAVERLLSNEPPPSPGASQVWEQRAVPRVEDFARVEMDAERIAALSEPDVAFILSAFSGDLFDGLGMVVREFKKETAKQLDAARLELRLLFGLQLFVLIIVFYITCFRKTVHFALGEAERIRLFVMMLPCHQLHDTKVMALLDHLLRFGAGSKSAAKRRRNSDFEAGTLIASAELPIFMSHRSRPSVAGTAGAGPPL